MKRHLGCLLAVFGLFVLFTTPVLAGAGTIVVKDGNGTIRTYVVTTNGSGNFLANTVLCDATAGANCAAVDSHGSLSDVLHDSTGAELNDTTNHVVWIDTKSTGNLISAATGPLANCGSTSTCNNIGYAMLAAGPVNGTSTNVFIPVGGSTSTNGTRIKNGAGTVSAVTIDQTNTAVGNFRFYDSASSPPNCASAANNTFYYFVQSNATSPGAHLVFVPPMQFSNGIGVCFTNAKGQADANNWAGTTGDVIIDISYL